MKEQGLLPAQNNRAKGKLSGGKVSGEIGGEGGGGHIQTIYLSVGDAESFVTGPTLVHSVVRGPLPGLHLGGGDLETVRLNLLHHVHSLLKAPRS